MPSLLYVYSFIPEILEGEVLLFIKDINSSRMNPLKSIKMKNGVENDLQENIEKLVME